MKSTQNQRPKRKVQQKRRPPYVFLDQNEGDDQEQVGSGSSIQSPQNHSQLNQQLTNQKQVGDKKSNWNKKQRIKYLIFLNYYSELPYWGNDQKSISTYKLLSNFIKTRIPQQCKKFHLSMRKYYFYNQQIIQQLKEQLENQQDYQKMQIKYQNDIINFQIKHKLLTNNSLQPKPYFSDKSKKIQKQQNQKQHKEKRELPQFRRRQIELEQRTVYIKQPIKKIYLSNPKDQFIKEKPINKQSSSVEQIRINLPTLYNKSFLPRNDQKNQRNPIPQQINRRISFQKGNSLNPEQKEVAINLINQNRVLQMQRNSYAPYQYPPFYPYSMPDINFTNNNLSNYKIPPPPGGIDYLFNGYSHYSAHNLDAYNRFQISKDKLPFHQLNSKNSSNHNQNFGIKDTLAKPIDMTQQKKQMVFQSHKHWLQWMAGVNQLSKRKQAQKNDSLTLKK